MIIPRDTDDGYYYETYNPWGTWGRWVLLAIVIIIIVAICASFFVRRKQPYPGHVAQNQEIPLGPVYPQDPTMAAAPPKYEHQGNAYSGPVWHSGPQAYGDKAHEAGEYYPPPPGAPPGVLYGAHTGISSMSTGALYGHPTGASTDNPAGSPNEAPTGAPEGYRHNSQGPSSSQEDTSTTNVWGPPPGPPPPAQIMNLENRM